MASTTIPTSKATNAYDLLSDVRALILAEPKRLHMNYWKLVADSESVSAAQVPKGFPECGTVACIGGWVETLVPIWRQAAQVTLGLDDAQDDELCYPSDLLRRAGSIVQRGNAQTVEHALEVAAHIEAFQAKYADQLKATKVQVRRPAESDKGLR